MGIFRFILLVNLVKMAEPIIQAKKLNFTYNKGKLNEFQALNNVDIEIYPGEFVIIFGPSGCGKSTLLNVMAGLETPDSGEMTALGRDLAHMNRKDFAMFHRDQIGVVYQAYNLIKSLNVLDNVALPQLFININKRKRNKKANEMLERFGIIKQAERIPTELSGGQQQRAGIARAIINDPEIILADEPTGNLDSVSSKNVMDLMEALNEKEKKTIIVVTHNSEQLEYADRIIFMKDGLVIKEVVNTKHKKLPEKGGAPKSATEKIKELMRTYQNLTPEQMNILIMPYKARIFTHHFLTDRTMEEVTIFEDAMQRRLMGTISRREFLDILDRSFTEGGVGFDKRTAEKIQRKVDRLMRIAHFAYQKVRQRKNVYGKHDRITDNEKAERITDYLFKTCYSKHYRKLDERQVNRIREAVRDRLVGSNDKQEFYSFLDLPFAKGGVGLYSKTAQEMTEEMELIMVLGFGINQKKTELMDIEGRKIKEDEEKAAKILSSQTKEEGDLDLGDLERKALEINKKALENMENKK